MGQSDPTTFDNWTENLQESLNYYDVILEPNILRMVVEDVDTHIPILSEDLTLVRKVIYTLVFRPRYLIRIVLYNVHIFF